MTPAINAVMPPHISATPNTTGVTPTATACALIMLSMNVGTPNANSASGAELPQPSVVAPADVPSTSGIGARGGAPLCSTSCGEERAKRFDAVVQRWLP